jgi:hypothetical protein
MIYEGEVWNCEPYGLGRYYSPEFNYIGEFKYGEFEGIGRLVNK